MKISFNEKLIGLLFIGFLITGCIEEIAFDTDFSGGQLVVTGAIIDRPGPYTLSLGRMSGETGIPEPVSGALVTIIDGDENRESYVEQEPGIYILEGSVVQGVRGRSYKIEIQLPDGSVYQSIPEVIPEFAARDTSWFELGTISEQSASGRTIDRPAIFVYAGSELPKVGEPVYFKWEVKGVYRFREEERPNPFGMTPNPKVCYVKQYPAPQEVHLFSSVNAPNAPVVQNLLAVKNIPHEEFFGRHYFNVIQHSISEQRYRYWERVDEIINRTGTIFDVPPATVPGNLFNVNDHSEQVLGYFEASAVDTTRFAVTRGDFPFHIPDPCRSPVRDDRRTICRDCLQIENSTLERPHYFGQ